MLQYVHKTKQTTAERSKIEWGKIMHDSCPSFFKENFCSNSLFLKICKPHLRTITSKNPRRHLKKRKEENDNYATVYSPLYLHK